MRLSDWIQIFIASITLGGVFAALSTSNKQIKTSNKQSLFEKRLDIFMVAEGFKQILEETKSVMEIPDKHENTNGLKFREMINNTYLNELWEVIPEPLDRAGSSPIDNLEAQRNFLIKKEEILQKSQTAELIFEEPENRVVSTFVKDYIILLDGRRRYEILLKEYYETEKQYRGQHRGTDLTTKEYLENHTEENEYRQRLLVEPIKKLSISYKRYCEQQIKIKEQISLKRGKN
ncbi:MAG: hypothetical protein LBI13_08520 [Streptococcaceae bacterium]|jgi:hypothetical protein|nr:hypothetical protein [Streptococcaceae bacterium]